jgi:hypothetical protein
MIVFVQLSKGLTTCDILLGQSTGAPNVLIDLIRDAIYVPHQIRAFWVTMQDNECRGQARGCKDAGHVPGYMCTEAVAGAGQ